MCEGVGECCPKGRRNSSSQGELRRPPVPLPAGTPPSPWWARCYSWHMPASQAPASPSFSSPCPAAAACCPTSFFPLGSVWLQRPRSTAGSAFFFSGLQHSTAQQGGAGQGENVGLGQCSQASTGMRRQVGWWGWQASAQASKLHAPVAADSATHASTAIPATCWQPTQAPPPRCCHLPGRRPRPPTSPRSGRAPAGSACPWPPPACA